MKIKRLLSTILCLAMVIGLVPAMSLMASADDIYYVGQTISGPGIVSTKPAGYVVYQQWLRGNSEEVSISGNKITFKKAGEITVVRITESCKTRNQHDEVTTRETFTYNVIEKSVGDSVIRIDSGSFVGGGTFPEFVAPQDANYEVTEATFSAESIDYYVGDKLPSYRSGSEIKNIVVTIKPKNASIFSFDGAADGKFHESTKYKVEYNGKTYVPYVKHASSENEMIVYLKNTFVEGAIYQTTIKDLEAPYHYGPLDKTATVESALDVVSIKYTMFNKELSSFSKGDNIGITVRVKTKDSTNKIDANGKAYWMEQKIYSSKTTKISDYEVEYGFAYKVEAGDAPQVQTAHFQVPQLTAGESLPSNVITDSPGVKVTKVTWTPADATASADKEYTVRIEFDKEDKYVWASDFEAQSAASVNSKFVQVKKISSQNGGGKKFSASGYYVEVAMTPVIVVDNDTSNSTTTTTTTTGQGTSGTVVGTTTTENINNTGETDKEETEKVEENKKEETKTEEKVEDTKKEETKPEDTKKEETKPEENKKDESKKEDSKSDEVVYTFPFADIPASEWYYTSVKESHKMGLINGKTATTYCPNDNMTYAEAVKLAVCMNILYNGGDPNKDIASGKDVWYSTYMKYALDNGIIDDDLTPKANEKITRKEYVYIFSKALPEKAFAKKNNIPSGSIPDIKEEKFAQDKAIYLFYRAGILAGNDSKGTFNPGGNITRAEVAAILIRMMDASARVDAPKDLGK